MKNPSNPKERNLLKGAIRRVFSRGEARRQSIERHAVDFHDPNRPRVTKWVFCGYCGIIFPKYQAEADHINPIIPVDSTLENMTWDAVVDAVWEGELMCSCKDCHKSKSKEENKQRREFKKGLR